jgi:hypothetical protein
MAHLLLIDDDPALLPGEVRQAFRAAVHRVEVLASRGGAPGRWLGRPGLTESEDLQLRRVSQQLADKPTDLERYIGTETDERRPRTTLRRVVTLDDSPAFQGRAGGNK